MIETTWMDHLIESLADNGESPSDIESSTLSARQAKIPFDPSYGLISGPSFTVWTKGFVYFPAGYDGSEWIACVPRNPNGVPTKHVGGGLERYMNDPEYEEPSYD